MDPDGPGSHSIKEIGNFRDKIENWHAGFGVGWARSQGAAIFCHRSALSGCLFGSTMTTEAMHAENIDDSMLVAESLAGNRDAFRRIVERYQTLISSLAYCATGDVSASEDIAQETFLAAWKKLAELREPAKLRPWLCGIARFRISKAARNQAREPSHKAAPLETMEGQPSQESSPVDSVVSEEERLMLWRALERIPMAYREPLVLFYRGHCSVEAVARDLDLSEDTVKQRLSRGRKLLREQVSLIVAGALKRTAPPRTFAISVIASLPALTFSEKAKAAVAVAKTSGAGGQISSGAGKIGAHFMNGMLSSLTFIGLAVATGRWAGHQMTRAIEHSPQGIQRAVQLWRTLPVGFGLLILPVMLVPAMKRSHHWLYHVASWSLAIFYGLVAAAFAILIWQRRRDARHGETKRSEAGGSVYRLHRKWVALGILGPVLILAKFGGGLLAVTTHAMRYHQIPATEALKVIAAHQGGSDAAYFWRADADARKIASERDNARFMVNQYTDGSKILLIRQPPSQWLIFLAPLDASLTAALAEKGIAYKTQLVGGASLHGEMMFHYGGLRGELNGQGNRLWRMFSSRQIHHDDLVQWLVVLSAAIVAAASVLLFLRSSSLPADPPLEGS